MKKKLVPVEVKKFHPWESCMMALAIFSMGTMAGMWSMQRQQEKEENAINEQRISHIIVEYYEPGTYMSATDYCVTISEDDLWYWGTGCGATKEIAYKEAIEEALTWYKDHIEIYNKEAIESKDYLEEDFRCEVLSKCKPK